jgi:hypothetical protein
MQRRHVREQQGHGVARNAWTGKVVDAGLLKRQQREQTDMIEKHRRKREELEREQTDEWNRLRAQHAAPGRRPAA